MRQIFSLGSKVKEGLERQGVALVYLYGSEALERSNRLSDVDVGLVFRNPRELEDRDRRFDLHGELLRLLEAEVVPDGSREIDLVFLQRASPVLQFEAINLGIPLFVADPVFRADYEASVMREYLDIRPLVEAHYQAALERAQ